MGSLLGDAQAARPSATRTLRGLEIGLIGRVSWVNVFDKDAYRSPDPKGPVGDRAEWTQSRYSAWICSTSVRTDKKTSITEGSNRVSVSSSIIWTTSSFGTAFR